jgi:hypothetical protein
MLKIPQYEKTFLFTRAAPGIVQEGMRCFGQALPARSFINKGRRVNAI